MIKRSPKLMVNIGTDFSTLLIAILVLLSGLSPASATPDSSCDRYIKQANEGVFQTTAVVNVAKAQIEAAEAKAKDFQALVKEGAVSQAQLDKATKKVQDLKKELVQSIDKQKQAQQQLVTLKNMTTCEALKMQ